MTGLDLSPCSNLRVLKMHPNVASFPALSGISGTISSKRFEKLIIGPINWRVAASLGERDQVLRSLAERLYELGAVKPLTVVLEFLPMTRKRDGVPDVRRVLPLFYEVGVIDIVMVHGPDL